MGRGILVLVAVTTAAALGLLEAAWTGPGRGAPTNTWLGGVAILIVLAVVTWPRLWWIPGLAIVEEGVHIVAGYAALPTEATLLRHWSARYLGANLYPWILFPILTIGGELIAWLAARHRPTGPGQPGPAEQGE